MPGERIQRQIDRLLDEAERAVEAGDWSVVRRCCRQVLALNPDNGDAQGLLALAESEIAQGSHLTPLPPSLERKGEDEGTEPKGAAEAPARAVPRASVPPRQGEGPADPKGQPGRGPAPSVIAGRYTVKSFLGAGGKKRVYLAHDTLLDREVAVALLTSEGLDAAGRERLRREAQAMGRLGSHPNIVAVFDLGTEPAPASAARVPPESSVLSSQSSVGQPYLVKEYLAGGDVEALLARSPDHKLPLEQTLAIARDVCRGLAFAHSKGIVHRDLKPGNFWLSESYQPPAASPQPAPAAQGARVHHAADPGSAGISPAGAILPRAGRMPALPGGVSPSLPIGGDWLAAGATAKIGDFGLALAPDRNRLTQVGMLVGTTSYLAPE